jgi:hypothetical protein
MTMIPMTREHPQWNEFCELLAGKDYCKFQGTGHWTCNHDHGFARAILRQWGFSDKLIDQSCEYFRANGGYCDCEILFNVDVHSDRLPQ